MLLCERTNVLPGFCALSLHRNRFRVSTHDSRNRHPERSDCYSESLSALRVLGRSGRDITGAYPELSGLPGLVGGRRMVLDGSWWRSTPPAGRRLVGSSSVCRWHGPVRS
jgi:hypothetical protein